MDNTVGLALSSNAGCFNNAEQNLGECNDIALVMVPYESLAERFHKILHKGDTLLVHLMLKQAVHSQNKSVMVQMINTLVRHAVNFSSKR